MAHDVQNSLSATAAEFERECLELLFCNEEREALQTGEEVFVVDLYLRFHLRIQFFIVLINQMHIQCISSHRGMWCEGRSFWN